MESVVVMKSQRIDKWCQHFELPGSDLKYEPLGKYDCSDCLRHNVDCPYEGNEDKKQLPEVQYGQA